MTQLIEIRSKDGQSLAEYSYMPDRKAYCFNLVILLSADICKSDIAWKFSRYFPYLHAFWQIREMATIALAEYVQSEQKACTIISDLLGKDHFLMSRNAGPFFFTMYDSGQSPYHYMELTMNNVAHVCDNRFVQLYKGNDKPERVFQDEFSKQVYAKEA